MPPDCLPVPCSIYASSAPEAAAAAASSAPGQLEYHEFFRSNLEALNRLGADRWQVIASVYEPFCRNSIYPYEDLPAGWTGLAVRARLNPSENP